VTRQQLLSACGPCEHHRDVMRRVFTPQLPRLCGLATLFITKFRFPQSDREGSRWDVLMRLPEKRKNKEFVFCFVCVSTYANFYFKQHSYIQDPLRECRSIRSGASGLPYYCASLVRVSDVIDSLAVGGITNQEPQKKVFRSISRLLVCLYTYHHIHIYGLCSVLYFYPSLSVY